MSEHFVAIFALPLRTWRLKVFAFEILTQLLPQTRSALLPQHPTSSKFQKSSSFQILPASTAEKSLPSASCLPASSNACASDILAPASLHSLRRTSTPSPH